MFLGGEPIVFHAEGGKIPGFDRTLALPLVLLLDAPAIDSQGVIVPDPTRDLALRWTRGAPDVSVFVQAQGKDATVTCQIDSTRGEATLPAEVMALTRGAYWSFFSMRSAYVDLDGVRTLLGLATDVYDATKTKRVTLATVP